MTMLDRINGTRCEFCILGLVVTLSGCTALPPQSGKPPLQAEIPAQWLADHDNDTPGSAWWREFDDAVLTATIHEAIRNNHDLNAAAARVESASAEARIAGANLFPQVDGGLSGARSKQVIDPGVSGAATGTSGPASVTSDSFGISLDISWELDVWGRIRSGASAAVGDLQAQQAEYTAAALSIAAQTAKAYFAFTAAQLQLDLAQETVESFRKTARQAANRVDAGVQSPADKHLTAANLSSAEALALQRKETRERAVRQLEILLGRYPAGDFTNTHGLPALPVVPGTGIPSELLARRPDLVAAERRLAAADKRVDAARAALMPRLSLTGSTGTSSSRLKNLLDGDFLGWTIAGNMVQPLFQGGRLRAQVDSATGAKRVAAENYASQVLTAFREVETALAVDAKLRLRETAQQRTAKSAGEAVRIAENRYGQGIETLLSVLEGQRRQLDAQSAEISAHRERLENRIDLYLALGGGFDAIATMNKDAEP